MGLYNNKKLASVKASIVDLGNSTKPFISENLTDCNHKFKCRKPKSASLTPKTFTRDRVVHIMKSNRRKSEKIVHMIKLVELCGVRYLNLRLLTSCV